MSNITQQWLDLLDKVCLKITPETARQAIYCVVDYIACAYGGAPYCASLWGSGSRELRFESGAYEVLGRDLRVDLHTSVLLNAFSAHALELDDGHRLGMLHLGAPILSALLPIAQKEEVPPQSLIRGIVYGYEAAVRLAYAIQPAHKERGYHTTGTCGAIGAALAISEMLGYNRPQKLTTLAAAATGASGLLEIQEDSSSLKPYNAAAAALVGVNAAFMGMSGMAGPDDPLGGRRGFLSVMAGAYDPDRLFGNLNRLLAVDGIYRKAYASCRHSHGAIDCALELAGSHSFQVEDILSIQVETYRLAVFGHEHKVVSGYGSAKMSIPYSVSAALVFGRADDSVFRESHQADQALADLIQRVNVREDPAFTALGPGLRPTALKIELRNGEMLYKRIDYPKGEPENPLTEEELQSKFIALFIDGGRTIEEARSILARILALNDIPA